MDYLQVNERRLFIGGNGREFGVGEGVDRREGGHGVVVVCLFVDAAVGC